MAQFTLVVTVEFTLVVTVISRNWNRWFVFRFQKKLFAIHLALMTLGKTWINGGCNQPKAILLQDITKCAVLEFTNFKSNGHQDELTRHCSWLGAVHSKLNLVWVKAMYVRYTVTIKPTTVVVYTILKLGVVLSVTIIAVWNGVSEFKSMTRLFAFLSALMLFRKGINVKELGTAGLKIETYLQRIDNEFWLAEGNSNENAIRQWMQNGRQERVSWRPDATM